MPGISYFLPNATTKNPIKMKHYQNAHKRFTGSSNLLSSNPASTCETDPLCFLWKPCVWSYVQRQPTRSSQPDPDVTPVSSWTHRQHSSLSLTSLGWALNTLSFFLRVSSQTGDRGAVSIRQSGSCWDLGKRGVEILSLCIVSDVCESAPMRT